ncbi:trypsin 3A1-like [Uranotaenia lowii]|uniref:trypsin 3A1-like n=1 Tax=Uranotaenia lowii TaxID=190385 RepID=UPI0024796A37|nr:trypsin 3A1-like [Uranotaenia lowii]
MSVHRFDYRCLMFYLVAFVPLCVTKTDGDEWSELKPGVSHQTNIIPPPSSISESERKERGTFRIINGTGASISEFPYLISIQRIKGKLREHICGGTFISTTWILTAAHCLQDESPKKTLVRAESTFHDKGGILLRVGQFVEHPRFNSVTKDYDCGLIRLGQEFHRAVPVTLKAGIKRFPPGEMCTVMGWGRTARASNSQRVRKLSVPIVKQRTCKEAYVVNDVTKRMLCAGFAAGGRDSCDGDSGGPLICRSIQAGIVSWAIGCAEKNRYGVYSDMSAMRRWIRNITNV